MEYKMEMHIRTLGVFGVWAFVWDPQYTSMAGTPTSVSAVVYDCQLTKRPDSLSSALFQHCALGTVFDSATLTLSKYQAGPARAFMIYTFEGVTISSFRSEPGDVGLGALETVGISFESVSYTVSP